MAAGAGGRRDGRGEVERQVIDGPAHLRQAVTREDTHRDPPGVVKLWTSKWCRLPRDKPAPAGGAQSLTQVFVRLVPPWCEPSNFR
ncbi:hypothetical protein GCM10009547_25720 [Sporichthya brevicatena]|uniref:Uncharacterized protein n=1 Tax=Sporichthya brevicatena TaxID=171442 RepID=A0ABN1GWK6_9ACTN